VELLLSEQVSRFFLYGDEIDDKFRSSERKEDAAARGHVAYPASPSAEPQRQRSRLTRLLGVAQIGLHALKRRDRDIPDRS
jgi:hypothetical protein